eukprot:TRINITY_DN5174_c0_g4_i2.p1 TRINITY_DN5174_c0_g4~~TRINITY_DN5174_c0_g4_i2.p1  ORF type:complete len:609 (+),score=148.46 TRINITY_DN5174_c0_g4_i2:103-1827(+)
MWNEIQGLRDPLDRANGVSNFWSKSFVKDFTFEFSRDRKSMSVLVHGAGNESSLLVKGAPEALLARCTRVKINGGNIAAMNDQFQRLVRQQVATWASAGLRCLVVAYRESPDISLKDPKIKEIDRYAEFESNLVFVGVVAMLDPPRAGLNRALSTCSRAGIRVIMVTGDNKDTAVAIAKEIGLLHPQEDISQKAFTAGEFMVLSENEQQSLLHDIKIFARVEPNHKLMLVKSLQQQGEVVAMTGDGVNDAPALKKADIGVAMGSGTAVAREASSIVLQDDDFSTIVMAVEQGRSIYTNTKQFIRYLISSNIGEVACIFLTSALGIPDVLVPVQLLWVNLVTDGLPATALGFNKPDQDMMRIPPRSRTDKIITGWLLVRYFVIGAYVGIATVWGYIWWFTSYSEGPLIPFNLLASHNRCNETDALWQGISCAIFEDRRPSTIGLSILVTIEMLNALNALSENQSLLVVPPWSNLYVIGAICISFALHFMILYVPFFSSVFRVAPINLAEWQAVLMFSIPIIIIDEIQKLITRMNRGHGGQFMNGMYAQMRYAVGSRTGGYKRADDSVTEMKELSP